LVLILSAGGLASGGCSTVDFVTGRRVNNAYTLREDIELGRKASGEILAELRKSGVPLNQDPARVRVLNDMVGRITGVSHLPDLPYEITLIHTNIVNAMAMPGGPVVVFEGLYRGKDRLVYDDDELAAVLAHEVAHVTCRHSTESITREMPWRILLLGAALYAAVSDKEDWLTWIGGSFVVYEGLIVTSYSRKDEMEADRVGMEYMARAGYDPRAAVRLWKRAWEREGSGTLMSIISTHPGNKARYEQMERYLPQFIPVYERVRRTGKPVPVERVPVPEAERP
jgi:predicted Zn-dependent protease